MTPSPPPPPITTHQPFANCGQTLLFRPFAPSLRSHHGSPFLTFRQGQGFVDMRSGERRLPSLALVLTRKPVALPSLGQPSTQGRKEMSVVYKRTIKTTLCVLPPLSLEGNKQSALFSHLAGSVGRPSGGFLHCIGSLGVCGTDGKAKKGSRRQKAPTICEPAMKMRPSNKAGCRYSAPGDMMGGGFSSNARPIRRVVFDMYMELRPGLTGVCCEGRSSRPRSEARTKLMVEIADEVPRFGGCVAGRNRRRETLCSPCYLLPGLLPCLSFILSPSPPPPLLLFLCTMLFSKAHSTKQFALGFNAR